MKWLPLESEPDLLNLYCCEINGGFKAQFVDVYGFEADLLQMVPQPVKAFMFLFPVDIRDSKTIEFKGKCWFSKQTIGNACGTVAVIHALANSGMAQHKLLEYIESTKEMTPLERGKVLEKADFIEKAHTVTAKLGSTEMDESTDLHFVTLLPINGRIVEFDGRYDYPIDHGPFTNFFEDTAKLLQGIVVKANTSKFNLMALVAGA